MGYVHVKQYGTAMLSEMSNEFTVTVYEIHYHLLSETPELTGTRENSLLGKRRW